MYSHSLALSLLAAASVAHGKLNYFGVAIAGFDFGCDIEGHCPFSDVVRPPLTELGGSDGPAQMKHFVENDGMNTFRLPTSWQYIVNNVDVQNAGELDKERFGNYDKLVQACLDTGAYCMIDLHNFARYDGGIIGQGGPSNDIYAGLWTQIATHYAKDDRVIFGLMNEPHDVDIDLWAGSCQAAVTAIRKAGAKTQVILLPGTNFASAATFVSTGSAQALANVTNPDGSTDGLMLDLHKYLDINNSGTHEECTTNNIDGFTTISDWLRENKRTAMISETGASSDESCMTMFCEQNEFIQKQNDVLEGFVGWGAGSFTLEYVLSLTPSGSPGSYVDNKLLTQCIIKPFKKGGLPSASSTTSAAPPTSTTKQILQETSASVPSSDPDKNDGDKSSSDKHSASDRAVPGFWHIVACMAGFAVFMH